MPKVPRRFKFHFPLFPFLLLLATLVLSYLNYQPNTTLSGWDNLHSEFNFALDFKRAIFSVWQEYRGLGLLSGMAPAADLPRIIVLGTLRSLGVVGPSDIRYLYLFFCLTLGPISTFYLFKNIFKKKFDQET